MRFQILGCGTSSGVPLPGCRCAVCLSESPFNKRTRCSGVIKVSHATQGGQQLGSADKPEPRILIDASTDLRQQALTHDLRRLDGVLFTHPHADHILGVEDLRSFNFVQRCSIPCFASAATNAELRRFFSYIFSPPDDYEGGGLAQLDLNTISPGVKFSVAGVEILPILLMHGRLPVLGFRINDFAYATDCNFIPEETLAQLSGVKTLIIDGLRYEPHPTHFTIPQACAVAKTIGAERTYLTHTAHTVEYVAVNQKLPAGVELAYDGLEFDI